MAARARFCVTPGGVGAVVEIEDALHVSQFHDLAALKLNVDYVPDMPAPVSRDATPNPTLPGSRVVVVGYPFFDKRDPYFAAQVLGDNYTFLALAPGTVLGCDDAVLRHNCTTTGGNSGSEVLDMATAQPVGLHGGGAFLQENIAVPEAAIRDFLAPVIRRS